jgi:hypothetical protein
LETKLIYSTYSSHDFVVLTSLTHPRKILLVLLQIGEQEKPKAYQHPYVVNNELEGSGRGLLSRNLYARTDETHQNPSSGSVALRPSSEHERNGFVWLWIGPSDGPMSTRYRCDISREYEDLLSSGM